MLTFFYVSKSTYFYTINNYNKSDKDQDLKNKIKDIFMKHKERYGYRRITLELKNNGLIINHKKVKRIMKALGLFGKTPKAKYKSYKGTVGKTAPNLLLVKEVDEIKHTTTYVRDFKTNGINEVWGTDVTEFHIKDGKLYLSPIVDFNNREVIAFNISKTPNYLQTKLMLEDAFSKYNDLSGLKMHSDQGWQYQMEHFRESLIEKGIKQSMSRKGNCLDNSIVENFFGILKNEMFYGNEHKFKSLDHLAKEIENYIHYYNNERITVKLKGLTPVQYRNQSLS
jgi:transposase InsO family protein